MDITDSDAAILFSIHAEADIENIADQRRCDPGVIATLIAEQLRGDAPYPPSIKRLSFGRWRASTPTLTYDFDNNAPGRITVVRVATALGARSSVR